MNRRLFLATTLGLGSCCVDPNAMAARRLQGWTPDPLSFEDCDQWKRVLSVQQFGWYEVETIEVKDFSGKLGTMTLKSCYEALSGKRLYVGRTEVAVFLEVVTGGFSELHTTASKVANYGRSRDGEWFGWSHRAIMSFCIGDTLFDPAHVDNDKPLASSGIHIIKTEEEAKLAARRFAEYVS